jgi:hypothetical protein
MSSPTSPASTRVIARRVLFPFALTFIVSRVLVYLIMAREIPDLYLHLGGTHVHHLNFGIFLLAGAGAYLLFAPSSAETPKYVAIIYGIGLALTFDEFGMWLHLGGSYWQQASFDAIVVLAATLALTAFAPPLHRWRVRHFGAALVMLMATSIFGLLLYASFRFAARAQPAMERMEQSQPR